MFTVCHYKLYQEYNKVKLKVHEFTKYTVSQVCTKDRSGKNLVFLGFIVDISGFLQSDSNCDIPFLLLFSAFTSVIHSKTGSNQGGELFLQLD